MPRGRKTKDEELDAPLNSRRSSPRRSQRGQVEHKIAAAPKEKSEKSTPRPRKITSSSRSLERQQSGSTSKKAPVKPKESSSKADKDDEEEEIAKSSESEEEKVDVASPGRRKRFSSVRHPKKKQRATNMRHRDEDDSETVQGKDGEEQEDRKSEDDSEAGRGKKRKKSKSENDAVEDRTCPRCGKVFTVVHGLRYHVDNYVCRQNLLPSRPVAKVGRNVTSSIKPMRERSQEEEEEEIDSDEEEAEVVSRHPKRRKTREAPIRYQEESDEESKADEEFEADDRVSSSRTKNSGGRERKRKGKDDVTIEDRTCPHCNKVFTVLPGMYYHIDNYVCRQDQRPGGPVSRGRQKVSPSAKSKWKRERGALKDRTCPNCKRVFTSVNGKNYHLQNRVCFEEGSKGKTRPGATLREGQTFVTPFGVVRVVKDERAIPAEIELSQKTKEALKNWKRSLINREVHVQKRQDFAAAVQLAKRKLLSELYETGQLNQDTVFQCYFGKDPRLLTPIEYPVVHTDPPVKQDPTLPPSSCPDRIVECILIPDKRERYLGPAVDDSKRLFGGSDYAGTTRLYLPRHMLKETYTDDTCTHQCEDCGRSFTTLPGIKYHVQSVKSCVARSTKSKIEAVQRLKRVDQQSVGILTRLKRKPPPESVVPKNRVPRLDREKSVKALSIYPQVLLSLGYKLLPQSEATVKECTVSAIRDEAGSKSVKSLAPKPMTEPARTSKPAKTKRPEKHNIPKAGNAKVKEPRRRSVEVKGHIVSKKAQARIMKLEEEEIINPDDVLRELERKLLVEQRKLEPVPKKKKKVMPKKKKTTTKKKISKIKPEKPQKLLPVIDTSVLVTEVDAGRYSSMSRFKGEKHEDHCFLCKKEEGPLLCCDFCARSNHFSCMLSRVTVKNPEPNDDFMCHSCVMKIQFRRVRAEKRRIQREGAASGGQDHEASMNLELVNRVVAGKEYECLTAQGCRVNDIVELLGDSKMRLSRCLDVAKVNSVRLSMIAPSEEY